MKYIYIEFSNGETYRIKAEIIAEDRAEYYAQREEEEGTEKYQELFEDEKEFALNDEYELKDWAKGNMNWKDVAEHAERVANPDPIDKESEWTNVDMKVRETDGEIPDECPECGSEDLRPIIHAEIGGTVGCGECEWVRGE